MIVILAPPPEVAYPFILNVEGYPGEIISFSLVIVSLGRSQIELRIVCLTQVFFF